MPKHNSGVMSKINNYVKSRKKHLSNNPLFVKYNKMKLEELIACYKYNNNDEREKAFILETIYLKVFFYFPSFLGKRRYRLNGILYDEALQNISMHILDAINRFDPSRGYPFLAYAYGDITAAMSQTFQEYNTIRLPQGSKASKHRNYFREEDTGMQSEGNDASEDSRDSRDSRDSEVVGVDDFVMDPEVGMSSVIDNPEKAMNSDISTDAVLSSKTIMFTDSDRVTVIDYDTDLHNKQLVEWLEEALSEEAGVLTEEERRIVILHNGLFGNTPMVYDEIALQRKALGRGSSRSRISQIHTRAISKLKTWFYDMEVFD